jgi:hypothetical protein
MQEGLPERHGPRRSNRHKPTGATAETDSGEPKEGVGAHLEQERAELEPGVGGVVGMKGGVPEELVTRSSSRSKTTSSTGEQPLVADASTDTFSPSAWVGVHGSGDAVPQELSNPQLVVVRCKQTTNRQITAHTCKTMLACITKEIRDHALPKGKRPMVAIVCASIDEWLIWHGVCGKGSHFTFSAMNKAKHMTNLHILVTGLQEKDVRVKTHRHT